MHGRLYYVSLSASFSLSHTLCVCVKDRTLGTMAYAAGRVQVGACMLMNIKCVYLCMYACMYVCMCVCVCVLICVCADKARTPRRPPPAAAPHTPSRISS
jgi:hypothetical protein